MVLRASKVQTKIFCNFIFDIKIVMLFYTYDNYDLKNSLYWCVYAFIKSLLDWQFTRK